ncbi:hypothetical protein AVEN_112861-1 [Araneus ventricosus]|uniref:Uncharacterized protein n=1 Tax=Araneus ventricosus TaxID=182803 RepID=A0A4Y2HTM7_ARAVE|nr:hypothetical protein AVEN_112861-1 [Araneus ventricosus]
MKVFVDNDMKPFEFTYERKQEAVDEKAENVILIEESEDEDLGTCQQEMEAAKMEKVIYLESTMVDFSTNLFVLIECWRCQNEGTLFIRLRESRS